MNKIVGKKIFATLLTGVLSLSSIMAVPMTANAVVDANSSLVASDADDFRGVTGTITYSGVSSDDIGVATVVAYQIYQYHIHDNPTDGSAINIAPRNSSLTFAMRKGADNSEITAWEDSAYFTPDSVLSVARTIYANPTTYKSQSVIMTSQGNGSYTASVNPGVYLILVYDAVSGFYNPSIVSLSGGISYNSGTVTLSVDGTPAHSIDVTNDPHFNNNANAFAKKTSSGMTMKKYVTDTAHTALFTGTDLNESGLQDDYISTTNDPHWVIVVDNIPDFSVYNDSDVALTFTESVDTASHAVNVMYPDTISDVHYWVNSIPVNASYYTTSGNVFQVKAGALKGHAGEQLVIWFDTEDFPSAGDVEVSVNVDYSANTCSVSRSLVGGGGGGSQAFDFHGHSVSSNYDHYSDKVKAFDGVNRKTCIIDTKTEMTYKHTYSDSTTESLSDEATAGYVPVSGTTNTVVSFSYKGQVVDAMDGTPLAGATLSGNNTTGVNGTTESITVENTLTQTAAPKGYLIDTREATVVKPTASGDDYITVTGTFDGVSFSWSGYDGALTPANGQTGHTAVFRDPRMTILTLPTTGGVGTMVFTIVLSALLIGGFTAFIVIRKKSEEK